MSDSKSDTIILYASPFSADCHKARNFLESREIEFIAFDVSSDPVAMQHMVRISGQRHVPVIVKGNQVIIGLDLARLGRLFPRNKRPKIRLGVSITDVKATDKHPEGVYVGGVRAGSLAERAGVKKGDIIIELAQHPIKKTSDIHTIMSDVLTGDPVAITVWRSGRTMRTSARA